MKHAKRFFSLLCVFVICFTLMSAPAAHATGGLIPQNFGAWISAGLMSLNIIGQSLMPAPGPVDPYFQWLSSPASLTQQYEYPVGRSVIQDYLNASTIVVHQGVTTIDGVEYDEVFVEPGTFTNGLKTNLFDFKTKWNILSGQSGVTLAEGAGTFMGEPVYSVNGLLRTRTYNLNLGGNTSCGFYNASSTRGNPNYYNWSFSYKNGSEFMSTQSYDGRNFISTYGGGFNGNTWIIYLILENGSTYSSGTIWATSSYVSAPFKYGYTSGVVPADQSEIPENYGLGIQIPHEQLQTFYNTYPQYNVDNSVINIYEDQVDIDQLTQAIFDQITSMEDIRAEWKEAEEPVPPGPVPPEPAEDVLEGVNTIIGQQYTQIQQNQAFLQSEQQQIQNQQQQIQNQQLQIQQQQQINQNTSDIKDAIENATETPSSEDLPDFKFDLRELFPFCIPFDIYNLLTTFDAEPLAPHVQIPFVIESLNFSYNIDLDFSVFNPVAQVLRTVEFIVYALGLAWATGKVIKW